MKRLLCAFLVFTFIPFQSFVASANSPCIGNNFTIKVTFDGKPVKFASIGGSFSWGRGQAIGNYCLPTDVNGIARIGLLDGENTLWISPAADITPFAAPTEFNIKVANANVVTVTDSNGNKIIRNGTDWTLELDRANFFGNIGFVSPQNIVKSTVNLACTQELPFSQTRPHYSIKTNWGYMLKVKQDCIVAIDVIGSSIFRAYLPVCSFIDSKRDCGNFLIPNPNVNIKIIQSNGVVSRVGLEVSRIYSNSELAIDKVISQNSPGISELFLADGNYLVKIPNSTGEGSLNFETDARTLEIRVSNGRISKILDFTTGGVLVPEGNLITIDYRSPVIKKAKFELLESLPGQFVLSLVNFEGSLFGVEEILGSNAKIEIRADKTIRVSNLEKGQRIQLVAYPRIRELGNPIATSDVLKSLMEDPNSERIILDKYGTMAVDAINTSRNMLSEAKRAIKESADQYNLIVRDQNTVFNTLQSSVLNELRIKLNNSSDKSSEALKLVESYMKLSAEYAGFSGNPITTYLGISSMARDQKYFGDALPLLREASLKFNEARIVYESVVVYLEDKLQAKKESDAKAAATKKTTITCVKGKLSKKVTSVKPKCPAGYKRK